MGASLACLLENTQLTIALIDPMDPNEESQSDLDNRAIALTYSTGKIFEKLGVWNSLSEEDITPIKRIFVSQQGSSRNSVLSAEDVDCESLGWNIFASKARRCIYERLKQMGRVEVMDSATAANIQFQRDRVLVEVESDKVSQVEGKLVVLADGGRSSLSEKLGSASRETAYFQKALVCEVETDRANFGNAYEHFCRSGPLALLPCKKNGYSVVWTLEPNESKYFQTAPPEEFLNELQSASPGGVGKFTGIIGDRSCFPLKLSKIQDVVKERLVVVGNAAHTVHPVAGQGFNLGLRDVAALAEMIETHSNRGWDIGSYDVLSNYESWRKREARAVASFTNGLIRIFGNDSPIATSLRSAGLDMVQVLPPVRRFLLKRTMGLHGKQSRFVTETVS